MIPQSIEELDRIREEATAVVNKRAAISAATSVVPIPGADVGVDIAIMTELLSTINKKFGLSHDHVEKMDSGIKGKVAVILSSMGNEVIGKLINKQTITFLLKKIGKRYAVKTGAKYFPLIGSAISATLSFGAMKYLGNSHIDDCYEVCKRLIQSENGNSAPA